MVGMGPTSRSVETQVCSCASHVSNVGLVFVFCRCWVESDQKICCLFVDAASTLAYCAAVLFCDGQIWHTASRPHEDLMQRLAERHDNQITSLVVRSCMCHVDHT